MRRKNEVKKFKIWYQKARGIKSKQKSLIIVAEALKPTIMVLNETHLQEEEITIPGYTVFRKDRSSNSGGIMIALKDIMKNIAIEVARMDGIHEGL